MSLYAFTKSPCSIDRLTQEIQQSSIVTALDYITLSGSTLSVYFKVSLSSTDETTLNGLITAHSGEPLPQNDIANVKLVEDITVPKDSDGSPLSRLKITKSGWTYQSINFEIQTSTNSGGVYCKDENGDSLNYFTYVMKDVNGSTTTTNADAVKTIVDMELPYDFELIKGSIRQKERPTTDIYYHCIIVPDISYASGGSRVLIRCVDLGFISPDERIEADGKSPKLLSYNATYHTNKIRFVFNHNAGVQHKILQTLEYYRA
jgi:hypothetical protein